MGRSQIALVALGLLALPSLAAAGLMSSPDGSYQIWFPREWYAAAEHELAFEEDPGGCSLLPLDPFQLAEDGLAATLKREVKSRKGGMVTGKGSFVGLGGREGAFYHSTRLRRGALYQMTWAAVALGDGRAALVALRCGNSSLVGGHAEDFQQMAGTAALTGQLRDVPLEQQEVNFGQSQTSP